MRFMTDEYGRHLVVPTETQQAYNAAGIIPSPMMRVSPVAPLPWFTNPARTYANVRSYLHPAIRNPKPPIDFE